MNIFDILLLGVALSMDAVAVSMTNGMTDSKMSGKKALLPALLFGVFQALMPLIGYYITDFVSSSETFRSTFEKASKSVAFVLLAFIGGKMIIDNVKERRAARKARETGESAKTEDKRLSFGEMIVQAFATSVDAFAVGISLKMAALSEGLTPAIGWSVMMIGCITFLLSVAATKIGRLIGNKLADDIEVVMTDMLVNFKSRLMAIPSKLAPVLCKKTDKAEIFGGAVLIVIGLKILLF